MLTRVYCDNYKCLVNFEFRPHPLQLLMGRNGAGKSTIFGVLELVRDFAARGEDCEERFLGETRTRWQVVPQQHFEIDVQGPAGVYSYKLVLTEGSHHAQLTVRHESVTLGGKPLFLFENGEISLFNDLSIKKVSFPFSPRRSGLAFVEARPENRKLTWLKSWFDALLYIQIDPKRMGARAEKEAVHPTKTLENFAEWYRHLRLERGSAMEAMRRSLTEVIDGFESLDLKDAGLNTRVLQVAARLDGKSVAYGFDELSDGQRALIGLYALLHCSPGHQSLVCIDEPDNFIALAEIQPWLSELQDAEETGLQVMIASHHPELLNQLATRNGIVLERIDGRQTIARPFAPDDDSTLTPAELVARGWELA